MKNETIVAPMTPPGVSAIAAIRVSGPAVKKVISLLFKKEEPESHHAYFGTARHPETCEVLDSLLYLFMEGPRSYTGEDTLEIYPHGNPLIVRQIIQALCDIPGVRFAHRGEYTERAFFNGKMDLIQAEAVADVIHSTTKSSLVNARRLLGGKFSEKVKVLSQTVKNISASLELEVDFAEDEVEPDMDSWGNRLEKIEEQLNDLLLNFKSAEASNRLPLVVVYGAPNAGKSSLINALVQEDRLLVSEIPGTTRDFVEVRLGLDGGEIRLIDTAGIGAPAIDTLDALSMEKSKKILSEADFKICLIDSTEPENIRNEKVEKAKQQKAFIVYSKKDKISEPLKGFSICSKTGEGLKELKELLNKKLYPPELTSESFWVTSERQRDCLKQAKEGVERALAQVRNNPAVELVAFEMQIVRRALQSVTGEISTESILQTIFSGFCIGK